MTTRTKQTKGKGVTKPRARASSDAHALREAKFNKVLALMGTGLSAVKACEEAGVPWSSFHERLDADPAYADRYARARVLLLERMAEEIHQIADTPVEGVTITTKADGGIEEKRGDMLEHRKLQIEARKWLLAKLMPKKYGDVRKIEHSGSIGLEQLVAGDAEPDGG